MDWAYDKKEEETKFQSAWCGLFIGHGNHVDPQYGGAGGQAVGPPAARACRRRGQDRQLHGHLRHRQIAQDLGPAGLQVPARISCKHPADFTCLTNQ